MTASALASLSGDPTAHDAHGRTVNIGTRVIVTEPCPPGDPLPLPGTIHRLHRRHATDLAVIHLDRGSSIEVDARELLEPCRGCNGEGGRVEFTRGSRLPDPQTEEVCDRCEGDRIEPTPTERYRRLAAVPACGHRELQGTCAPCQAAEAARLHEQTRDAARIAREERRSW